MGVFRPLVEMESWGFSIRYSLFYIQYSSGPLFSPLSLHIIYLLSDDCNEKDFCVSYFVAIDATGCICAAGV